MQASLVGRGEEFAPCAEDNRARGGNFPGFGAPMQNNVIQYVQYAWPFYVMNNKTLDDATYFDFGRWSARKMVSAAGLFARSTRSTAPNKLLQQQLQHPPSTSTGKR
jgi:hypothetical protein